MSKWTEEVLIIEAAKYANRTDFNKGKRSAYDAAVELGILDQLFPEVTQRPVEEVLRMIGNNINLIMVNPDHPNAESMAFYLSAKCSALTMEFIGRRDDYNQLVEMVQTAHGFQWSMIALRYNLSPALVPYWPTAEERLVSQADQVTDKKEAAARRLAEIEALPDCLK